MKCSNKKHSEINAISYCIECNLYLCNKCKNNHIEYLEIHHLNDLDKNNQALFTGMCTELNHKDELKFYCRNHNKLCCAACLCKIKIDGKGQHYDCDVCHIEEIKEEKNKKLNDNIKYLEDTSKTIKDSIKKLKDIYEKINDNKEKIKLKISNIFSKIRNALNEREDELLLEIDNIYDKTYFKEDLIKNGEKISNKIISYLQKGKLLNTQFNDNDNKLNEKIYDCINIENNIKNIIEINENINKCNSKKINITFLPEEDKITEFLENIKTFGDIFNEDDCKLKFVFKPGNNYIVSNNGFMATKNNGKDNWNCVVVGDKEIPKNKITKWKIKINKNKDKSKKYSDIYIGIGPQIFKGNLYDECWSIFSGSNEKVGLKLKDKSSNYKDHLEVLKEGDIIEVIVDRKLGNLSFAVNDINYGIACSTIPKNDSLYPTIVLFEQGLSVEIVQA